MPESNDAVSVTDERNGNRPTRAVSVEIEDALNDGHAVESVSAMQLFCAIVAEMLLARSAHSTVAGLPSVAFRRLARGLTECRVDESAWRCPSRCDCSCTRRNVFWGRMTFAVYGRIALYLSRSRWSNERFLQNRVCTHQ